MFSPLATPKWRGEAARCRQECENKNTHKRGFEVVTGQRVRDERGEERHARREHHERHEHAAHHVHLQDLADLVPERTENRGQGSNTMQLRWRGAYILLVN